MDITYILTKLTTGALMSVAVAVASLGLAAGTADASYSTGVLETPRSWAMRETRMAI